MNVKEILKVGRFWLTPDGYWEAIQWLKMNGLWEDSWENISEDLLVNYANLAYKLNSTSSNAEETYVFRSQFIKELKEFFIDSNRAKFLDVEYKICKNGVQLCVIDFLNSQGAKQRKVLKNE